MWSYLIISFIPAVLCRHFRFIYGPPTMFRDEQIIFSSNNTITSILVPVDGKYIQSNDIPRIFFAVSDPKLEAGSCIYVLEGFAAYEVLEGGKDATADYGAGKSVYFGAKDGMYKYDPETLSAKRYGAFKDDIIQIQKANGTDLFYILTSNYKIFKLENKGTVKSRVTAVVCAKEFVLDTSNNIYYIPCKDNTPRIVLDDKVSLTANMKKFKHVKLLRPAFVMEDCIPLFGDNTLHILYANGTCLRKNFTIEENPSAYSVDAALYLVAGLNGKLYEFNVMEVLLKSMFGMINEWPTDVNNMVVSMIETAERSVYNGRPLTSHNYV